MRELPSTKIALARLGVGHVEDATLLHAEVTHILRVLAACDGNRSLAATVLGIERRSLQRKLRDIDPERLFVIPGFRAPAGHKRGPKPRIDGARVLEMRAAGHRWHEIAKQLRCSATGAMIAAQRVRRTRLGGRFALLSKPVRHSETTTNGVGPRGLRALAKRLETSVAKAGAALNALAKDPSSPARRIEVLQLRYHQEMTLGAIGAHYGVTSERIRQMLYLAHRRLAEHVDGQGGMSGHLRGRITNALGSDDWSIESAAARLECSTFLATKHMGWKTLAEFHRLLGAANLSMKCGCPQSPCLRATGPAKLPRETGPVAVVVGGDSAESRLVSRRLAAGISRLLDRESWTLAEIAPALNCRIVRRMSMLGRASLKELLEHLYFADLKMACGCPGSTRCTVSPVAQTVPDSSNLSS